MKYLVSILMAFGLVAAMAEQPTISAINVGGTGTTSATAVVPPGDGFAKITDVSTQVDAGNVSATVDIRVPVSTYTVTSATAASGTVIYIGNSASAVAIADYVIVTDASGNHVLRRVTAAATTSITVESAITGAMTTACKVYEVASAVRRPANHASSGTASLGELWLPANGPSALTLDGNTTACKISVGGQRVR